MSAAGSRFRSWRELSPIRWSHTDARRPFSQYSQLGESRRYKATRKASSCRIGLLISGSGLSHRISVTAISAVRNARVTIAGAFLTRNRSPTRCPGASVLTRSIIVLHPVRHVGGVMFLRGSRQFEVGTIGEMELFSASSD